MTTFGIDLHGHTWLEAQEEFIEFYNGTLDRVGNATRVQLGVIHGYGFRPISGLDRIGGSCLRSCECACARDGAGPRSATSTRWPLFGTGVVLPLTPARKTSLCAGRGAGRGDYSPDAPPRPARRRQGL